MGHKDVKTTMIYTHVLNRPGTLSVRRSADVLRRGSFAGSREVRQLPWQPNLSRPVVPPSHQLESGQIDAQTPDDFNDVF